MRYFQGHRFHSRVVQTPVATKAHPLVHQLFAILRLKRMGIRELCVRAGLDYGTVRWWRGDQSSGRITSPTMEALDRAFKALGYELTPRRLPSE